MKAAEEKTIFAAYEIGLVIKGAQALLEVVLGVLISVTSVHTITTFVMAIANGEIAEIPNDIFSDFLINTANHFSTSGKVFLAFYLLSHGIIKLVIIISLFLKKRWSYPLAFVGLSGLILYQLYHLMVRYSLFVLLLTVMDIVIVWLIWHEYKLKRPKTRKLSS